MPPLRTRTARQKPEAWLLLGPTGAGKTPLGRLLAARGIAGRRCAHFDFGECLRLLAAGAWRPAGVTAGDRAIARRVLRARALLADGEFGTAERIFRAFRRKHRIGPRGLVVLNGIPRHVGQAEAVDRLARVTTLVRLDCTARTVARRIRSNAGGDRAVRTDDAPADIARKLADFRARTLPLVARYKQAGSRILTLRVGPRATAEDVLAELASATAE